MINSGRKFMQPSRLNLEKRGMELIVLALTIVMYQVLVLAAGQAGDSINIATEYSAYALGERVHIDVVFRGATHGTITLSMKDSRGIVLERWSWDHLEGDVYERRVSVTPTTAGKYLISAVHEGHHGEPPVSDSKTVAVWSAKIKEIRYPEYVDAGKSFDVKVAVDYWLGEESILNIEVWNVDWKTSLVKKSETVTGGGSREYVFTLRATDTPTLLNLSVRAEYLIPDRGWQHDVAAGWYKDFMVPVSIRFLTVTTTVTWPVTLTTTVLDATTVKYMQTYTAVLTSYSTLTMTVVTATTETIEKTVELTATQPAYSVPPVMWLLLILVAATLGLLLYSKQIVKRRISSARDGQEVGDKD